MADPPMPATALPEESVWDYPRPPRLERFPFRLTVHHAGITLADSIGGFRVLETSHPPTYYIPQGDIRMDLLRRNERRSLCEWKGQARYFDLVLEGRETEAIAWTYPKPVAGFVPLADTLCFYASKVDRCAVDGVEVKAQAGDFYGGWLTPNLKGPFKGGAGTLGW